MRLHSHRSCYARRLLREDPYDVLERLKVGRSGGGDGGGGGNDSGVGVGEITGRGSVRERFDNVRHWNHQRHDRRQRSHQNVLGSSGRLKMRGGAGEIEQSAVAEAKEARQQRPIWRPRWEFANRVDETTGLVEESIDISGRQKLARDMRLDTRVLDTYCE